MTSSMTPMNGVDRQRLFDTIDAIKSDRTLATFRFRVRNRWIDGSENRSVLDGYYGAKEEMRHTPPFELVSDEPPVLLGTDKGPNPVEFVLHALAGCLTITMVYHAAARGIALRGVATRFEGDIDLHGFLGLDPRIRRGYQAIRVAFEIDADMDDAGKQDLIAMAQKFSPTFDIVSNGVPVSCTLATEASSKKAA
jgi:uncharacterized OsmC-like protein